MINFGKTIKYIYSCKRIFSPLSSTRKIYIDCNNIRYIIKSLINFIKFCFNTTMSLLDKFDQNLIS